MKENINSQQGQEPTNLQQGRVIQMPNFKSNDEIVLQPNDADVIYEFEITTASTSGANDGYLAYGRSVSSVEVKTYEEDGTEIADLLDGSATIVGNLIRQPLQYPTTSGEGRYKLTFIMTLDDASVKEADFFRVYAEDV